MSFCTYLASNSPLQESTLLWPLSRGGEDIYTEKTFVAQIVPGLEDLTGVLAYIQKHMENSDELEVWHIWQGVEPDPIVRSETVYIQALTVQHLTDLRSRDVFATTTQYEIPVQYRIVVIQ